MHSRWWWGWINQAHLTKFSYALDNLTKMDRINECIKLGNAFFFHSHNSNSYLHAIAFWTQIAWQLHFAQAPWQLHFAQAPWQLHFAQAPWQLHFAQASWQLHFAQASWQICCLFEFSLSFFRANYDGHAEISFENSESLARSWMMLLKSKVCY